jgi:hypothetical protein
MDDDYDDYRDYFYDTYREHSHHDDPWSHGARSYASTPPSNPYRHATYPVPGDTAWTSLLT